MSVCVTPREREQEQLHNLQEAFSHQTALLHGESALCQRLQQVGSERADTTTKEPYLEPERGLLTIFLLQRVARMEASYAPHKGRGAGAEEGAEAPGAGPPRAPPLVSPSMRVQQLER